MLRFANSPQFKKGLETVLKPWSDARRGGYNPSHYGYTGDEWVDSARELEQYIKYNLGKDDSPAGIKKIKRFLEKNKGYEWSEAGSTVRDISNGKPLRQLAYGIPAANADEEVSKFLLERAGFTDVKLENFDPVTGTDLSGNYKGRDFDIDAQTRTRPDAALSLGVLGSVPNVRNEVMSMTPEMKLKDLILQIRSKYPNHNYFAREDKLLHTRDVDLNPSRWLKNNIDNSNKDLIITSARPSYQQTTRGLLNRHGPYDPTLPKDWGLINLNNFRNNVLNMNKKELNENDIIVNSFRKPGQTIGKLQLVVSNDMIKKLTSDTNVIDPLLIQALTQ